VGEDGSRRAIGGRRVRLDGVAFLHVRSARSGYVIVPRRTAGVTARALRVRRQSSAPHAGPTLALRLPGRALTARLAPAGDPETVAARLRWD
jgi:hypothetical protein